MDCGSIGKTMPRHLDIIAPSHYKDPMQPLLLQTQNHIATITLNRPDVHNAFSQDLMRDLHEVFLKLDADASVRAVILTGAGKSFCAGGDLNYMKSAAQKDQEQNVSESLFMAAMFQKIDHLSKPLIGVINGAAFGGGVGLVSVCDLVVAHEKAVFSLSEVKLGLAPSVISPFVIAKIGASQARRYFLTGERFGAEDARRIGLVHEVYTDATKDAVLSRLIESFLSNGPHAMAAVKELIRKNRELEAGELTDYTANQIATLRAGAEGQEGIAAFFEKRAAKFLINLI